MLTRVNQMSRSTRFWLNPRSVFGVLFDAELRESVHWPGQHSFVAPRHDRSLDQFRMVGHNPDNFIIAQVSPSHKLSVGLLVRSQRNKRTQPNTTQQLFKRISGERLRKIVDGL